MNRRQYVASACAGVLGLFAGCWGGNGDAGTETPESEPPSGDSVPGITLGASNVDPSDPAVSLSIRFDHYTSGDLAPGQTTTVATAGRKWVIVRMDVSTVAARSHRLQASHYVLDAGGTTYEVVPFEEHFLGGRVVPEAGSVTGWIAFRVPEETDRGFLTVAPEKTAGDVSVAFEQAPALDPQFPPE